MRMIDEVGLNQKPDYISYWLNWIDEDDDEVGLNQKPDYIRFIKKRPNK